jgi:CBS domain containing-hemolysin-like protein
MSLETVKWAAFLLASTGCFLLSLLHVVLNSYSRISLSRALEKEKKEVRSRVVDRFDEFRIAVEFVRVVFLLAFVVFLFLLFPGLGFYPLWHFLLALAIYVVVFDFLPRLITFAAKDRLVRLLLPALPLVDVVAAPVARFAGMLTRREELREEKEADRETTDEEIETFIDEATEEGIIDKGEDELLRSVVEFGDLFVREIMTPRVNMVCVRKEATIDELKDLIIREKYSRIPVYRGRLDNIEGVVMAKDLLEYADEKHKGQPILALVRPAIFVPEMMPVSRLLKEFQRASQKMAIVVDEHGGVSGLVTLEDVIEEIVGEIQDEYDTEEAQIVENAPGDFIISGSTEVEELEELFDLDLAEDDFITAGGLVTGHLGRFPEKGEKVNIRGLTFDIVDADQKTIKKLRVRRA